MNPLPRRLPIWPGSPRASQPRPHVHQVRGPDCAISAAATITGVSYDHAASVAFSLRESGLGGMRPEPFRKLLVRLTDVPWRAEQTLRSWTRLRDWDFGGDLVAMTIVRPGIWPSAHAIVVGGGVVYDGSVEHPVSPRDHPSGGWYVSWVFRRDV